MSNSPSGDAVNTTAVLHIAVGVLINDEGRVLIAQRRAGTPGAGKWEFPGGKREAGEGIEQTLRRELNEELGINVERARPLLRFQHDYSQASVLLDIWRVQQWQGKARGCEGQRLVWSPPEQLQDYDLLSANKPIVDAIRLPQTYVISPEPGTDKTAFLRAAEFVAAQGMSLLRLRAWSLDDDAYEALARALNPRLTAQGAGLILDRGADMLARVGAAGLHWPEWRLLSLDQRPIDASLWFAISCHSRRALLQARECGADYAVLSAVQPTQSHPDDLALGWDGFAREREGIAMPVYALGGLGAQDLAQAFVHGAQGVAGISAFWPHK